MSAARPCLYSLAHMADRGVRRVPRWRSAVVVATTALTLALLISLLLWTRGTLNPLICDGECGPAYVTAPLALTGSADPGVVRADRRPTGSLDAAKVKAAVDGAVDNAALGQHVGLAVLGPTGEVLDSRGSGTYIPASTTKVLTGYAALSAIAPQEHFTTRVVLAGDRLILVGGGDPYLLTKKPQRPDRAVGADLTTLASRTVAALKQQGVDRVELGFDGSLFTGPTASDGWKPSYISGNIVTPVSALWADQGAASGIRSADPAASAGKTFRRLLEARGIEVGEPTATKAPAGAAEIAAMKSATVSQIVDEMIRTSDNQAAEVMLRHIAIASGRPATFEGGTDALIEVLERADVDTAGLRLRDGSGLSRDNRISPATLTQTLMAAVAGLPTASLVSDLPVSGFTGTLSQRFSGAEDAYGMVRAKTGTLTGVHSLAGYVVEAGGLPMFFALMSDGNTEVGPAAAQAALDRVAAALAGCSCGA